MKVFQLIRQWFSNTQTPIMTSEMECPNCWGWQEYQGEVLESSSNEKIDLHNIDQKKGWIVAYATRAFTGLRA